jgi:Holliday junction resolvase-like predicted endonuclease|tara:strand:- start:194 stop:544 length:351 start_codon:yes stop_codon:yes gene_type:complete
MIMHQLDLMNNKMKHSSSRKGDLAEYYAVTWLWDQGYEVFPNAGCSGPVDMIATKDGEVSLIDVKTESNGKNRDGSYYWVKPKRSELQIKMGVKLLGYNPLTRQLRFVEHKDGKSD